MEAIFEASHVSVVKIEEGDIGKNPTDIVTLCVFWEKDGDAQNVELEVPAGTFVFRSELKIQIFSK